ncbi:MAG: DEAD/DEAH box helicase [Clostridiaceae bacterium]|nr:DEAD/DEAH box helicase [Clostridiaceae bacterium]
MQKITREMIRQMASSETVFYRGMRYYAAHAVSHVTWNDSNGQYRAFVKGNNQYVVTVQPQEQELVCHCNCPAYVKYAGICKHIVAVLLFIADYQRREEISEDECNDEKTAYQVIEYFRKREYRRLTPQYYHLELQITIPEFLKDTQSKAYVSLYAGDRRMYKVPNTKKFIEDYYQGKTIRLGKEFCFVSEECAFDEASRPIMEYLTEIYEIQETLGRTYYSNLFSRQELVLSKRMLGKLLHLAEGMVCRLNLREQSVSDVKIIAGNPSVQFEIGMEKDVLSLENRTEGKLLALAQDGSILFYDGSLYLPTDEYICNILPFYATLLSGEEKRLEFKGENQSAFIEKVLPVIKKTADVIVPPELKNNYIVEPLIPQLYLDILYVKSKCYIQATLQFVYGTYKINPLIPVSFGKYILVRDKEEEERLTRILYDLNFKVQEENFILRREEDIFLMMTDKLSELTDNFQVFYSKEYQSASVQSRGSMAGRIRLDSGINFLEIDLEYSQVPLDELKDFFRAIRLKKRYFRLKNGAFIDLQERNEQLQALEWFVQNGKQSGETVLFPQYTAVYLNQLLPRECQVQKDYACKKLLEDISHPEKTSWELPENVHAVLRPYQETGYRWLQTLAYYGMGGILADDMGLGKTLQTILYLCAHPGEHSLIVCPTSIAFNWQEEFEKFAPDIRTVIISGTPPERQEALRHAMEADVVITTYPLLRKDIGGYVELVFDHLIIDEAQFIKNRASLSAKAVKAIQAKHRFALTGTPIENDLSELWSVFDFMMPGFFPGYAKFSEQFEKPIVRGEDETKLCELKRRIQPFVLRRMKKDVLHELPDKIETMRMAEMTKKQEKIYLSYLSRTQEEIRGNRSVEDGKGRMQILAALTRLRQICCHPGTFVENYTGGSGKLALLMEQLPVILDGGHSVIIFSQFTSMLSIIAKELEQTGILFYYLAGSTKAAERRRMVKGFNEGKVKVFLVSLKAGGTGLNLTGADTVIHFDPWWNPAVEDQATDRAYRIGQTKKVQVIKYVMEHSIEEKIYQLQKKKKELSSQVIDSGEVFLNQLTQEELYRLFEL